jgi:hypothetical protein
LLLTALSGQSKSILAWFSSILGNRGQIPYAFLELNNDSFIWILKYIAEEYNFHIPPTERKFIPSRHVIVPVSADSQSCSDEAEHAGGNLK